MAYYDELTNLPNRRLLLDRMDHALGQAKRYQRSMAVMFLDLDHFKDINDSIGHDAGDEVLKQVARNLSNCVRNIDTISRLGGDEFVVVLTELAQLQDAERVAEKLIDAVKKPVVFNGKELAVTTSIGIAVYPFDGCESANDLLKKADMAMYFAKADGRNDFRFFKSEMRNQR